jgi:hypothetical protein
MISFGEFWKVLFHLKSNKVLKMGQITQESNFGSKLKEMTERDDVKTIIEIGTWNGQGSTKCILSGMNNTEKHLYSLEANKSMYEKCVNYYTPSHPNLTLLYGTLHRNIMNVIEIVTHPMFNKVRDHFFLHYTQDVIDITKSDLVLLPIDNVEEFYTKCLPAQVQLAEKIRRRGGRVDVGSRLEFLVLSHENVKAKQYDKIESADYYKEHSGTLEIDHMYYLKALANPLDQVLECTVGEKDFTYKIYKQQLVKEKVLTQLKEMFRPKISFVGDEKKVEEKSNGDEELFLYTDGASKGNP